ncbi:ester cyclase [Agrobacterium vitis]|uniref:ester cyclase n=1 Tax=Agrobacterium vitis TaxID=373 RepID=UPI0018D25101|nr:ester cyclase [Agrobacterium vitis]
MMKKLSLALATAAVATTANAADTLTLAQAKEIIAPFYDALNEPAKKDVAGLISKATTDDWVTCGGEGLCLNREQLISAFKGRGETIPDLRWEIRDVMVAGDRVIVRGQASGTPVKEFYGVPPTGKTFKIMSVDIQTIRDGRIAHSYHVEDWAGAIRQLTTH